MTDRTGPSVDEARAFIEGSTFHWHQGFDLVPGVPTPGVSSVRFLWQQAGLPQDLTGWSVLDIGTSNGGTAIECERRGATRVVAVDVLGPEVHGVEDIIGFLGSGVEFVQSSVYELPERLDETFDLVVCWGVLYHLRHPLLGLDAVRRVAHGRASIETAVAAEPRPGGPTTATFFRRDELGADPTNWFAPTPATLTDWVGSAGFRTRRLVAWPEPAPTRALVDVEVEPGLPEYLQLSYERPLRATVVDEWSGAPDRRDPSIQPPPSSTAPPAPTSSGREPGT